MLDKLVSQIAPANWFRFLDHQPIRVQGKVAFCLACYLFGNTFVAGFGRLAYRFAGMLVTPSHPPNTTLCGFAIAGYGWLEN
ncbi:hypothetical protein [Stieleria tagensis]|uniref:hypothetical protein n=1 Tax=Stieleria tagensis TaxID=2956795 RepID=UPI00209B54E3|nr:hypothetical protein [Stieleria tagensis]